MSNVKVCTKKEKDLEREIIGNEQNTLMFSTGSFTIQKNVRTIQKKSITCSDLKILTDILQIFPHYNLVVFDNPLESNNFRNELFHFASKYEDVNFMIVENEVKEKVFFDEKNTFFDKKKENTYDFR